MASSASALPWLWVIEALASFKQVDASILKELVKSTPEITGDMGKNAREMVYFRVLDTLASQQVRIKGSVSSAPVCENKIDPSESCENVVLRILQKRADEAESLKLEAIQNFVTRKRASLPKCTLQKLKDAILEGKHPALASFKEKSGLLTSNKARVETSTNDVPIEAIGLSDGPTVEGGNLTSPNAEKLNDISQKDCGNRNLAPSKRSTNYLEDENRNQAFRSHTEYPCLGHGSDTPLQITKKPKHCVPVTGLVVGHEPLSADRDKPQEALVDLLLDLPDKEAQDGLGTSKAASPNRARENICCEPNPNSEKFQGRESNTGQECSSDSGGYHEERLDISTKRLDFLSSNCTLTEDSLATADCTELSICTKCDKGGDLLVCSGSVCPIVVHQGCLGAAPSFDSSGKFFCPFCSYSHAISEYLQIKKKASMARKDLKVFIGVENGRDDNVCKNNQKHQNHGNMQQAEPSTSNINPTLNVEGALGDDGTVLASTESNGEGGKIDSVCHPMMDLEREQIEDGHRPKRIANKSNGTEQNQQRKDNIVNRNNQNHQHHAINFVNKENTGVTQQSKGALVDDGATFASKESNREGGKVGPEYEPAMASEGQQVEASDSQNRSSNREREIVLKTKKHASVQVELDPNADVAASSEEEDGFTASDYIMRPRKQEMKYTYPAIPQLSRKRVQWTPEEEEVLEEGVNKFSGTLDRATRWKQILEFGSRVFQKGRTPIDLKDKWRNICKRRTNL